MKIKLSELRHIVSEEVKKSFGKAAYSLKVARAVSQLTSDPKRWMIVRDDIADMAQGGTAGDVRQYYYPDWSDDEFKQLWVEMGQDASEIGE